MKIRPLHDRVVARRVEEERTSPGGIVIPDSVAGEKPTQGEVISVGKGKMDANGKLCAPDVKKGDRILFGKYAGTEIKVEGEELLILREDDIMGVLED